MAQIPTGTQVALLGTVVLLLDNEAEEIGRQFLRLCLTLDPVAQARVKLLRVTQDSAGRLMATPFAEAHQQLVVTGQRNATATATAEHPYLPFTDPNATQFASSFSQASTLGAQDFESALRGAIQEALRISGTEPLTEHGYALVANELAVHLVGRIDAPLLASVAEATSKITRTISAQTDARRFALLLAAAPQEGPSSPATAQPGLSPSQKHVAWQTIAKQQPWETLLSWHGGQQPSLLYAFLFEAWDEAGRFHERPQLYYAMAEALFALFATGMLEQRAFKEALDLSTAATEGTTGLMRIGSIGGSMITSPTQGMIEFLAYRLAADVLLRRGLLGEEGAVPSPELRTSIPEQTKEESQKWLTGIWQQRVFPDIHELPRRLPARKLANGSNSTWHPLALSMAGPNPNAVLWRWDRTRLPLDQEQFWNLAVQNEYETTVDLQQWSTKIDANFEAIQRDLQDELIEAIQQRAQMPEGIERARAFTQSIQQLLTAERLRLTHDAVEQQRQMDQHYLAFEDQVRRNHYANGITERTSPPAREQVPTLPGNLEALAHEALDGKFTRVAMPATMLVAAVVLAVFGAVAVNAVPHVPGFAHWPSMWRMLFTDAHRHWVGAGIMLVLFGLASLGSFFHFLNLRRWQRQYVGERLLLRLDQAKKVEREHMLTTLDTLLSTLQLTQANLQVWAQDIHREADLLTQQSAILAHDFSESPTLSRDIFVAQGTIWEGNHPEELYLGVRARQPESKLVISFLHYVQVHAGGVPKALNEGRLRQLALTFMTDYLRTNANDDPFEGWSYETAKATIERALQAARVAMQPMAGGRPLAHFTGIMAHGSVNGVARVAQEEQAVLLPAPTPQWCFVVRMLTRAQHPLVQAQQRGH